MRMTVSYTQARDFRWRASEPVSGLGAFAIPDAARGEWLPTATSDGACMALSTWWIIQNAKGADFWTWLGAPAVACQERPLGQSVTMTQSGPGGVDSRVTIGLAKAGEVVEKIQAAMRDQKAAIAKEGSAGATEKFILVDKLVAGETTLRRKMEDDVYADQLDDYQPMPGYAYFSISGVQQNGKDFFHGVAAQITQQDTRFFDPNFGECKALPPNQLKAFLLHLAGSDYGLKKGYKVEYIAFA